MKAKIIFYSQKEINPNTRTQFKKKLTGHNDSSHGGKYKYKIKGILDDIDHIKPCNAALIIKNEDFKKITELMNQFNIKYTIYNLNIDPKEFIK